MLRWLLPEGAASLKSILIKNRNTEKLLWHKVHMALSRWPTSCLERFPAAFIFPCSIPRGLNVAISCGQCSNALVLYWWMIFTFTSCFSVPEHCIVLTWIYLNFFIKRLFSLVWGMPSGIKAHAVAQTAEILWQTLCLLDAFPDGLDTDYNVSRVK